MADVSLRALDVCVGAVQVLRDLNLDIDAGEFVVLLGPSGCGKTTLLNAIAGLLDASAGQIWINARNVTWEEPKDRGIGMVFQSYALYPRMSVEGNLSFGLKMAGVDKGEIRRRVAFVANLLHITPLLKRRPADLSGGQQQRVAIGRALVRDVDVFLFDEPLSNLDASLRGELRVELKRLHRQLGKSTMIYVTHDQVEALTLASRIAVMNDGAIAQFDTPRIIYRRPANRFVAGFVGSPRMNFLRGEIDDCDGQRVFVRGAIVQALQEYEFSSQVAAGTPVDLGIRPEDIVVAAGNGDFAADVDLVEPMGAETILWANVDDCTMGVRVDGESQVQPGARLNLTFPNDRLHVFDATSGDRL